MWKFLYVYVLLITCKFVHGDPKVPCHFIFGDSFFDAGNNNDLSTTAKANYAPYGVDFPGGVATGRFTNGLTSADILTKQLGFQELMPRFSTAFGSEILKGVNYASGGAGILSQTGSHLGDRKWLARQVKNHGVTISKLRSYVEGPASNYLNKCLYTMNIGSNDYVGNYFMPQFYSTKNVTSPDDFATTLVTEYEQQLKELYRYGARKTAIFGLPLIGCIPMELQMNNAIFCVEEINKAVHLFNQKLILLVDSLNAKCDGVKFTFIDLAAMQSISPLSIGLITNNTCCKLKSDYQCDPSVPPCPKRSLHAFMDGFHQTETVNYIIAILSFNSPSHLFVHPYNINNLVSS